MVGVGVGLGVGVLDASGADDADTAGGKLGGTTATAVVRLESRLSAETARTTATTANAASPMINPRLYTRHTLWPAGVSDQGNNIEIRGYRDTVFATRSRAATAKAVGNSEDRTWRWDPRTSSHS